MGNLYDETKFLMKKYNIVASKSLGQNFLVDDNAVEDIIEAAQIGKNDLVIEIGPGLGTLTKELLENAGKVIAIELDERMIKILNDRFSLYENLEIINEDVLKVDLKSIIKREKEKSIENVKIVANLPYYITTPIMMKLLEDMLDIESITVMIQKEVADRIVSTTGSKLSGAITYCIDYYSEARSVRIVERDSFIPAPNVDSEVINLKIRKTPKVEVKDKEMFFEIIKHSFMQRRKTLINCLVNGKIIENKEVAIKIMEKLNFDKNVRGEALSIEDFARLTNFLCTRKIL